MNNISKRDAERLADLLSTSFGGSGATCSAIEINNVWYAVTSGTGEGQDYAYDPDSCDLDALAESMEAEETAWDYSAWCNGSYGAASAEYTTELEDAAAYYLATGRHLGDGGSIVLKERDAFLLEAAYYLATGRHLGDGGSTVLKDRDTLLLDLAVASSDRRPKHG